MKRMIDPDEALELVLGTASRLPAVEVPRSDALGLVLAEDIRADRAYPPFSRAMMDGYVVHVADAGCTVPVVGEVAAGEIREAPLSPGTAVEIMTGAPCPEGTEAVAPKEDVELVGDLVRLPKGISSGKHIAPAGSECAANAIVAARGIEVLPLVIANLATFGRMEVSVIRRPRCAVITTGGELAVPGTEPSAAQIRNSNGPMIEAMARQTGLQDVLTLQSGDTVDELARALSEAGETDLVILSGGVSVGKYDMVPAALKDFGVEIVFHKVTQKPGKPLLFGCKGRRLFFGLPGNPLACHLGFHRYIASAIRKMMGRDPISLLDTGRLTRAVSNNGRRTRFVQCHTVRSADGWEVTVLDGKGSADIFAACESNSYIRLEPGVGTLDTGHTVPFAWVGGPP